MKYLCVLFLITSLSCKDSVKSKNVKSKEVFLNQSTYDLTYYSDWNLDDKDEYFDIESDFLLDAPSKQGFISFGIFPFKKDYKTIVENHVKAYVGDAIENAEVTYFNSWGKYSGYGARLKGKVEGNWPGEIVTFAFSTDTSAFNVDYQILDKNMYLDQSGIDLAEQTFRLKK